ncbi:hypothetical protein LWI28_021794 [Acer negundo]|uniref:Epidermal patterning factor-like protein n=1 Tax=Acer negundo TaxID=4023 RepID=A0AAD5NKB5_ACENE|nr:hypothetical protein LWI28_021794 [Acer negundo]
MVLGSKPPGCVNKCLNCRPCTATLVIPSNHDKKKTTSPGDGGSNPSPIAISSSTKQQRMNQPISSHNVCRMGVKDALLSGSRSSEPLPLLATLKAHWRERD